MKIDELATVERWRTAMQQKNSRLPQGDLRGLVSVGVYSRWPACQWRSAARTGSRHGRSQKTSFATSASGTSASTTTCSSKTTARRSTTAAGGCLIHSRNTTNFANGSYRVSIHSYRTYRTIPCPFNRKTCQKARNTIMFIVDYVIKDKKT